MIPLIPKLDTNLIFIDEAGFNFDTFQKKAWCDKGKPFFFPTSTKSVNYSVCAAITKDEIVGYIVVKGSITWEYYLYFLGEIEYVLKYKK